MMKVAVVLILSFLCFEENVKAQIVDLSVYKLRTEVLKFTAEKNLRCNKDVAEQFCKSFKFKDTEQVPDCFSHILYFTCAYDYILPVNHETEERIRCIFEDLKNAIQNYRGASNFENFEKMVNSTKATELKLEIKNFTEENNLTCNKDEIKQFCRSFQLGDIVREAECFDTVLIIICNYDYVTPQNPSLVDLVEVKIKDLKNFTNFYRQQTKSNVNSTSTYELTSKVLEVAPKNNDLKSKILQFNAENQVGCDKYKIEQFCGSFGLKYLPEVGTCFGITLLVTCSYDHVTPESPIQNSVRRSFDSLMDIISSRQILISSNDQLKNPKIAQDLQAEILEFTQKKDLRCNKTEIEQFCKSFEFEYIIENTECFNAVLRITCNYDYITSMNPLAVNKARLKFRDFINVIRYNEVLKYEKNEKKGYNLKSEISQWIEEKNLHCNESDLSQFCLSSKPEDEFQYTICLVAASITACGVLINSDDPDIKSVAKKYFEQLKDQFCKINNLSCNQDISSKFCSGLKYKHASVEERNECKVRVESELDKDFQDLKNYLAKTRHLKRHR